MKIELIKVEAVETPEEGRGTWNSFRWEVTINGLRYGLNQVVDIEFNHVDIIEHAYDLFNLKVKEIDEEVYHLCNTHLRTWKAYGT